MGTQKNVPKIEEEKNKFVAAYQVNNELLCVLFKRTSYTAKKNDKKCEKL